MAVFTTKKIGKHRALGAIFKAARTHAGITLEQAEVDTKVRLRYLRALEQGQYHLLPSDAYNLGFVRCYAEYLQLNSNKVAKQFKEECCINRSDEEGVMFSPKKMSDWHFLVTPKLLGSVMVILFFGLIIGYIGTQLKKFTRPPDLELINVPAEFSTTKDTVELNGKTTEGAVISINNEPIIVTPEGKFDQNIQLAPGINQIAVVSRSRAGKETQKTVQILYNPDLAKLPSSGY